MDPRDCESTSKLLRFRLSASQKLSELQQQTDIIIEDEGIDSENKLSEIAKLITSTRKKLEEEEFSAKVNQQIIHQIDHFEGKVSANLQKMHTNIADGSARVLIKLRQSYGAGLLHHLLIYDWSMINK